MSDRVLGDFRSGFDRVWDFAWGLDALLRLTHLTSLGVRLVLGLGWDFGRGVIRSVWRGMMGRWLGRRCLLLGCT